MCVGRGEGEELMFAALATRARELGPVWVRTAAAAGLAATISVAHGCGSRGCDGSTHPTETVAAPPYPTHPTEMIAEPPDAGADAADAAADAGDGGDASAQPDAGGPDASARDAGVPAPADAGPPRPRPRHRPTHPNEMVPMAPMPPRGKNR